MLADDARHLFVTLLLVVGGLLPIVNPVGVAPMFLAMTHGTDERTRHVLAAKIAVNSFILIMGSLIFGAFVLKIFGLSVPVVQVAGGAVLIALGWDLLNSEAPAAADTTTVSEDVVILRAFYPLTLPLTVDPGAISVAITIGASHTHNVERALIGFVAGTIGTALIAVSVWLAYYYAERVARWLGHARVMVVLRLSAFIVLCIGVEITWNGVKALAADLSFAPPAAAPPTEPAAPAAPHRKAP